MIEATTTMKPSRLQVLLSCGLVVLSLLCLWITPVNSTNAATASDYLDEDSVVLITGAAGFLGSELAMALHRVYQPKKIICVDSMDKGFGILTPGQPHAIRTERDLALFEFKRQRVFHLMQVVGSSAYFYRVDFRPSIPEFFDTSEVPVLHHIFEDHRDITHVVHFADHYHHGHLQERDPNQQAVPRLKSQAKAGMMESLLEELRLQQETTGRVPHFVYASSSEVYNHANPTTNEPNIPPFREDLPITTPSTMTGTSKLMDEILAHSYYQTFGIYSVGLRFFQIYGPWGLPGSPIFEMAERAVAGENIMIETDIMDDLRDYLYIDDAMDAVMAAMQYRPVMPPSDTTGSPPVIFNVGSGKGTPLRAIAKQMQVFSPGAPEVDGTPRTSKTVSFASMDRASRLLGFRPQVPLKQGIETLLAWHYDRAFPYGGKPSDGMDKNIASKGVVSCSRYDQECLRGTPVFPCASECSHEKQCIPSFWDDVLDYSRALTVSCDVVMYTVALDIDLNVIPSTYVQVTSKSVPHVQSKRGHCNIAFVSDQSPLYKQAYSNSLANSKHAVKHGFWALVAVRLTEAAADRLRVLRLLPKLSPGLFFARTIRKAIYCDHDVIFDSIPRLLDEASMQPKHPEIRGATAILIGKGQAHNPFYATVNATASQDLVQAYTYRTIRLAVIEEMAGDGFAQMVDSSFLVHALNSEDSRLFRCDVYGEVVQWNVTTDRLAFEFILGLHDMWSRVIARKSGHDPWWIGEQVRSIRADDGGGAAATRIAAASSSRTDSSTTTREGSRRLQEGAPDTSSLQQLPMTWRQQQQGLTARMFRRRLQEESDPQEQEHPGAAGMDSFMDLTGVMDAAIDAVFGVATGESYGTTQIERDQRPAGDDDLGVDDDQTRSVVDLPLLSSLPEDPSAYDVWMGILSSTPVRYFGRIVTMEAVGAIHVDRDGNMATLS